MNTNKEIMGYVMFYPDGSKFGLYDTIGGAKASFYQHTKRLWDKKSPFYRKKFDEQTEYTIKPLVPLEDE